MLTLEDITLKTFDSLDVLIMGSILFCFIALDELIIAMVVTTEGSILVVLFIVDESSIETTQLFSFKALTSLLLAK